jgi:MinD-like ATPase involved in chromosome partitioning or flagellar assembly/uncharacterized protein involved in exopolysaccharide biosynthesis
MRVPQLAAHVTSQWDVRDRNGNKLAPEYFIEPGKIRLLLGNAGQGVKAEWISDTQQFSITGYSRDPDRAAAYARDYMNAFLDQNSRQFRDILGAMLVRLNDLRNVMYSRIKEIDRRVEQVKIERHTGNSSVDIEALSNKIATIQTSMDTALLSERVYQTKKDQYSREMGGLEKLRIVERTLQENPQITVLKTEIETLTGTLIEASVDYTSEHPDYKKVEKKLKSAKETLKNEALKSLSQESSRTSSALDTALASILQLTIDHIAFEKTMEHYNSILASYQRRMDELVATDTETSTLLKERDNLFSMLSEADQSRYIVDGLQNGTIPFFRVVSPVNINKQNLNYYKYFPKRKTIVLLTAALSFILLSFLALGKEMHANSLYRGWQLSALDHRVRFADVPELERLQRGREETEVIICSYIRNICLSVRDSKILRISSVEVDEGKATLSWAIAWYFHKLGKSVVIVDGDVTCQPKTQVFGTEQLSGEAHSGDQKDLREGIIQESGIALVPASRWNSHTQDKDYAPHLRDLFSALAADYERIIFVDCPLKDDRLMLADGLPPHDAILVLRAGAHSIYEVEQINEMNQLTEGRTTLKGVVVNRIPFEANILTLEGLFRLCLYIIRKPLSLLRRRGV